MHRSLLTGEAALPDFLGGEGNDRRGVADKRMEQRVEHSAIGASLGICGRIAVEAIFADIEKESAEIILREGGERSEEHTSELQSLMRISYAVFCLKKKKHNENQNLHNTITRTTIHYR